MIVRRAEQERVGIATPLAGVRDRWQPCPVLAEEIEGELVEEALHPEQRSDMGLQEYASAMLRRSLRRFPGRSSGG
jgi:hypothetical protein